MSTNVKCSVHWRFTMYTNVSFYVHVVPQTVKYVLKSMFQAHVARFSGVPRAPFAAIGVGLTELCFLHQSDGNSFPSLQKAAFRVIKHGLLRCKRRQTAD